MRSENTPVYFTKLELQNIRSFGEIQCLDLADKDGKPARWTLILGDNGVGKTTLLQCLARMVPRFNEIPDQDRGPEPNKVEPELAQEEDNAVLMGLTRPNCTGVAKIRAELKVGTTLRGTYERDTYPIITEIEISTSSDGIERVQPSGSCEGEPFEPLVLAYGAGRHMGVGNLEWSTEHSSSESLFDTAVELFDAEETLYQLEYLQLKNRPHAGTLLEGLKELLTEILPTLKHPDQIDIRGRRLPGSKDEDGGVWVTTPSGTVQFTQLSLGYQTVAAWTSDIAWRMLIRYSDCENPLLEPAIVIVDEIDLHLHPLWQRSIRKHLTDHFPAVQFIATAHSPLMAQDALDTNLAVLHDEEGQASITSSPSVVRTWRLDQILTSELFGVESARPSGVAEAMKRRIFLINKEGRTDAEEEELVKLNYLVHNMQTAEWGDDEVAMKIVRQAAELLNDKQESQ